QRRQQQRRHDGDETSKEEEETPRQKTKHQSIRQKPDEKTEVGTNFKVARHVLQKARHVHVALPIRAFVLLNDFRSDLHFTPARAPTLLEDVKWNECARQKNRDGEGKKRRLKVKVWPAHQSSYAACGRAIP